MLQVVNRAEDFAAQFAPHRHFGQMEPEPQATVGHPN